MGFGLADRLETIEKWHSNLAGKPWLGPFRFERPYFLMVLGFMLVALALNVGVRMNQYQAWSDVPEVTVQDGAFLYSTADAPHFLEIGRKLELASAADNTAPAMPAEDAGSRATETFSIPS